MFCAAKSNNLLTKLVDQCEDNFFRIAKYCIFAQFEEFFGRWDTIWYGRNGTCCYTRHFAENIAETVLDTKSAVMRYE